MTIADVNRQGAGTAGSQSARPRRGPRGRARMTPGMRLLQLGLAVAVLAAWEVLVRVHVIDEFFFPRPSEIFSTMWLWISSGYVFPHLWVTIQESLLAFIVGAAAGLLLGFALARIGFLERLFQPFLQMFNALPRVVLAPIFLLWFGLGIWSKVAFGFTLVFFIVFFNTLEGVKSVDRVLIDNARMLGATERQLLRHVFIPSALTWIFSSLHTSLGFAMVGAVVGEYLGAARGLGYVISQAEGTFDTTGVFAGMAVLGFVVLVVSAGVKKLERWLLRWKLA